MPHRAASPIHRPVSPVSPVGTAGVVGSAGSGQLGHGLGPQHLAAHGAGVGLDALTLRGGGGGDLALALRMLGVHGEGDGNGVAEAVGGRQGLDALGSGNGELTRPTSSTGWPLRVTLFRLGSVTVISAVRQ